MSTWLPSPRFSGGVLVVPMEWSNSGVDQDALVHTVAMVDSHDYAATGITLSLPSGASRLVAAADAGPDWFYPTWAIALPPGPYSVLSAEVHAEGFWLRLHALQNAT